MEQSSMTLPGWACHEQGYVAALEKPDFPKTSGQGVIGLKTQVRTWQISRNCNKEQNMWLCGP